MHSKAEPERPPVHDENGVVVRPALEVLAQLKEGRLLDELSLELNRVVKGVRDCSQSKPGKVTLTLTIEPLKKHTHNAVSIRPQVVGKAPEDPPESTMMFFDDDGNLHVRNPRQRDAFEDGPRRV